MADRSLTSSALGARGGAPTPGRGAGATATAAASSRGVQQRASLSASVSAAAAGRSSASAMPTARERRAAVDRLDAELLSELKEAFQLFDSDEDGAIDAKELKAAFKALGVDVKTADVRRMLGGAFAAWRVGRVGDGGISGRVRDRAAVVTMAFNAPAARPHTTPRADIGRDDGAGVDFDTFLELVAVRLPARDSPEEVRAAALRQGARALTGRRCNCGRDDNSPHCATHAPVCAPARHPRRLPRCLRCLTRTARAASACASSSAWSQSWVRV